MIYIASPYTHPVKEIRDRRYAEAVRYNAFLLKQGISAYSPIAHTHAMAQAFGLPVEFEFWQAFNFAMIRRCSAIHVLQLIGWNKSKGIDGETAFAALHNIPITYIPGSPTEWQS